MRVKKLEDSGDLEKKKDLKNKVSELELATVEEGILYYFFQVTITMIIIRYICQTWLMPTLLRGVDAYTVER